MSLEQAIHENTAAIRDLIAAISKGVPVTPAQVQAVVQEAAPEKKSSPSEKSSDKVTKSQAVATAAEQVGSTPSETSAPASAPAAADITLADITTVVLALGKAGKRDALVKLLGEYGVPKASALDPSKFAEFHAKANALLEV